MSELFEAWFDTAADGWSPSTVRQNCSVLNCHLHHHIGSVTVGDATPAADRRLVRSSAAWQERSSYAGGGNGRQNSRRDEFGVLAGDALGMGLGQPCGASPSDRSCPLYTEGRSGERRTFQRRCPMHGRRQNEPSAARGSLACTPRPLAPVIASKWSARHVTDHYARESPSELASESATGWSWARSSGTSWSITLPTMSCSTWK